MQDQQLVRTFHDIFNRRDWAALEALIAPEQRFLDVPMGQTTTGPAGIKEFFSVWADAFPDSRAEINELHGNDGHVTDVFTFRGTHTKPLRTPAGDIPATNKKVELAGCFLFETRGGKIVASRNYYDLATIMRQLGVAG
jgi:steroid delta-isomerase-like uncharacterized protein